LAHFAIAIVVTSVAIVAAYSFIHHAIKNADGDIFPKFLSGLMERRGGKKKKKKNIEDGLGREYGTEKV
jgi:predicted metalloendopeptidase